MTAPGRPRGRGSGLSRPRAAGALAGITAVVLAVVVGAPVVAGADDADPPESGGGYAQTARNTAVGKPLDLLVHPESGKLYVGSDTVAGTTGASLAGLYAVDPASGQTLSWVKESPGSTGQPAQLPAKRFAGPLPGDGVHYLVGLRGIAAAKDGEAAGRGGWLTGTSITQAKAGAKDGTVVVLRGTRLEEVAVGETSVTVERSLTLPAGGPLAVDRAAGQIWVADNANSLLRRVDSAGFALDGTEITLGAGAAVTFLEWDTEHGVLWAGRGAVLEAYDISTGKLTTSFTSDPGDSVADVAVDPGSDQAFAVWQDFGNPPEEGDGVGRLAVYDTAALKDSGEDVELPGVHGQLGASSVAVTPGGESVFVGSPADGSVTTFQRPQTPPSESPSPTESSSPTGGPSDPEPEPDPSGTDPTGDPTADPSADPSASDGVVPIDIPTSSGDNGGNGTGGSAGGSGDSGSLTTTTGGGSAATSGEGILASTGTTVLLTAGTAAALLAGGTAAVLWRRRATANGAALVKPSAVPRP
ncbi:hypothetical protein [Streptomyces flaveus]|uniref:hypothetical protein n=1 Tax=Streptomyces flaveus TaxID=66370 RepID=UPI003317CE74